MELDPKIKALATAIKKQESGGSKDPYNTKGASGEFGAYQFMPDTWKGWAKTHLGDENAPMTMENQNKVAYNQIKSWKDKGYNPAQIAAAWNAGEGSLEGDKWKTNVGKNSLGVSYDTPSYVKNVSKYYQEMRGRIPETDTNSNITPQGIDISGLPTVTPPEQSVVAPAVNVLTKAPMVLGSGVLNLASMAGIEGPTAPGPEASYSNPLGKQQDALGYRDGKELGAWDTTKQGAGALIEGLSYGVGAPEIKSALQYGKSGVLPYLKESGKAGGKMLGLSSAGTSLQEGDNVPTAIAKGAVGYGAGYLLGGVLGIGAAKLNKTAGYSPEILDNLDSAVKAGDTTKVAEITTSPQYSRFVAANKLDDKAVKSSINKVRTAIEDGIDKSYGGAKLTRAEKAETLTDDGITAMVEHMQNTKNPIFDTKLALENKANDLMDEALNPIINKVRDEKLPLVPLDRKSLLDDFNTRLDKTYLTDLDKEKIRDYVSTLINRQNEGNPFGIVDAGIIRRNANFDFVNPKNKGAVSRLLGNTMRDALGMAEKKATDPQTKAIIAHINAVNKEYSRLMQGVDVVDLMARFPGQKGSELLNKAAGFMGAGATGNNPLAYLAAHRITNNLQNMAIRSKNNALFGDLSGKAGPITSSELIGNAQRILNNVGDVSNKQVAVNKLMETIIPKRDKDLPNIAYGAAPFGVTGLIDKVKNIGKETYQREPEPVKDNTEELASQIANAETRGEKDPYKTKKWSDRKLGPASPLGRDLGKYQITSARLREKSEAFLGKKVTDEEFLNSPELQDKFIREQIKWQKKNGLSDDEILATHRRGWGNMKPEQLKKAVDTSKNYIAMAKSGK